MQDALEFTPSQLAEIARLCGLAEAPEHNATAVGGMDARRNGVRCTADIDPARQMVAAPSDAALAAMIDTVLPEHARKLPVVWMCGVLPAGLDADALAKLIREHCERQGIPLGNLNFSDPVLGNGADTAVIVLATTNTSVAPEVVDPETPRHDVWTLQQREPAACSTSHTAKNRNKPPARAIGKDAVVAPYARGGLSAALFDLVNGTAVPPTSKHLSPR